MGLLQKKREQSDRAVTKEELLLMERIVELRKEVSDLRGQLAAATELIENINGIAFDAMSGGPYKEGGEARIFAYMEELTRRQAGWLVRY